MGLGGRTVLLVGALLLCGLPLAAEIGTIDAVPAATLLLPYFEVDLDDPEGITTLLSVNNAFPEPAIAHVTLWTDLGIPTFDFNVFLTGYDVVTFNLRELFVNGRLPATSHNDPGISPVGSLSLPQGPETGIGPGATSCDDRLLPRLPENLRLHIRAAHTGQPSPLKGRLCSGAFFDDDIARGYITVDNVNHCTLANLIDCSELNGYFVRGGTGAASNRNQLWGDYFYVHHSADQSQGFPLVHIEASDSLGASNHTFYRRFCSQGQDQREGLGSMFAARFLNSTTLETDLLLWQEPKCEPVPFNCANRNDGNPPLGDLTLIVFDEAESSVSVEFRSAECPSEPTEGGQAGRPRSLGSSRLKPKPPSKVTDPAIPFESGWIHLLFGPKEPEAAIVLGRQGWVTAVLSAEDCFSVGFDAVQLDNVTYPGFVALDSREAPDEAQP